MQGLNSEGEEEKFCRVCRCEGTEDQPLYHPCKCRGSIKYIHQDCLQFWLEHSNKDTCDICHSKFQFKVIFKDGVPNRVPLKVIVKSIIKSTIKYEYMVVKYMLMGFMAIVEIPVTIIIINQMLNALLGMDKKLIQESDLLSTTDKTNFSNLNTLHLMWLTLFKKSDSFLLFAIALVNNFIIPGLLLGAVFTIVLVSMIIIQSIIASDEGFRKIINKKIGSLDTTRYQVLELLERHRKLSYFPVLQHKYLCEKVTDYYNQHGWNKLHQYTTEDLINIRESAIHTIEYDLNETIRRELQPDLAFLNTFDVHDEMAAEEIESLVTEDFMVKYIHFKLENQSNWLTDEQKIAFVDSFVPRYPNDTRVLDAIKKYKQRYHDESNTGNDQYDDDIAQAELAEQEMNARIDMVRNQINRQDGAAAFPQRPRQQRQQPADAEAAAVAQENEPVGLLDGPKNMTFIFQVTILANFVSFVVLFTFKQLPLYFGMKLIRFINFVLQNTLAKVYLMLLPHISERISNIYTVLTSNSAFQSICELYDRSIAPKLFFAFCKRNLYDNFHDAITNTINNEPSSHLFEQIFVMFTFFTFIGLHIYLAMKYMEKRSSPQNPLNGMFRQIYIILLEIVSVVKVFTLIVIEWALFPLFCGVQIEFALVPIFNEDIYNYKLDPSFLGRFDAGLLGKWFMGTFFMYFFAAFVSMVRSKILRTGVLFFIRPSDDPNVQLVHDALMRPFALRFSRIALSAAVYSAYIHIEFSLVSWSIRLLSPENGILPFHNSIFYERAAFVLLFVTSSGLEKPFLKFWEYTFQFACEQSRLSSFLLNKDNVRERGKIVYRSFVSRFSKNEPNFNNPVLKSETKQYFIDNPDESCCFVPDGNYIRAPDNDHVSRKFARTLFVAVTKADELLEEIPQYPDDEEKYNPYGDADPLDATTYTIVYRPPSFKLRLALCFSLLWLGSMVFTLGLYLSNFFIGKLFFKITGLEKLMHIPAEIYKIDIYTISFTFIVLSRADFMINYGIQQYNAVKEAVSSDSGRLSAVKKILVNNFFKVREQITIFFNTPIAKSVVQFLRIQFAFLVIIILGMLPVSGGKLTNTSKVHDSVLVILLLPLVMAYTLRESKGLNLFFQSALTILFVRLCFYANEILFKPQILNEQTILEILSLSKDSFPSLQQIVDFSHKSNISPDKMMIFISFSLLPAPLNKFADFFAVNEFFSIEAWIYFSIWSSVSVYITANFIIENWIKFDAKIKENYYDNQKILSNAEDDEIIEELEQNNSTAANIHQNPLDAHRRTNAFDGNYE